MENILKFEMTMYNYTVFQLSIECPYRLIHYYQ